MLLIVASRHDREAISLATCWAGDGARLLSAEDLSQPGWRFYTDAPDKSVAVVGGTAIPCREITGVLIRRPYIIEAELAHIHSADRHYVAAEMSAFLFAWLVSLTCPMLNRPRDFYLLGPPWRQEQWMRAAAALGIALAPIHRMMPVNTKDFSAAGEPVQVIVVAGHCFGVDAARFAPEAASVAAFAGVDLLGVIFENKGGAFIGATLRPELSDPAVREAVRDYLTSSGRHTLAGLR
jgi:hypothetical protein